MKRGGDTRVVERGQLCGIGFATRRQQTLVAKLEGCPRYRRALALGLVDGVVNLPNGAGDIEGLAELVRVRRRRIFLRRLVELVAGALDLLARFAGIGCVADSGSGFDLQTDRTGDGGLLGV